MNRMMLSTLIFALGAMLCGCGGDSTDSTDPGNKPSKGEPTLTFQQSQADNTSLTFTVTLTNADSGYCMLSDNAPSISTLRAQGRRITASGDVRFTELNPGTTYTVYGVAERNSVYSAIISSTATTTGQADDHYPAQGVQAWQTTADKSKLFAETATGRETAATTKTVTLTIDESKRYQSMEGFGPAITGSSAYNLLKMSAADRSRILHDAFDPEKGLGYNYVRVSIGTSDFALDDYTCCDTPGLEFFALHEYDKRDLIPVLKEILAINPEVKVIAAPWTAPRWMKCPKNATSGTYDQWAGGTLNPAYYADYAEYFVLWINEMEANGIRIEAITPQNEPLHDGNSASTYMDWSKECAFVRDYLGPAFEKHNIQTKIWIYDHNFDVTDFVTNIYKDKQASKYIDGSAWHAYGGSYTALAKVHSAAPDKSIYFTEQSIGTWCPNFGDNLMWHISDVCLGTISNYCRAVVLWNFMLDQNRGPWRPGGCSTCYGFVDCDTRYVYSGLTYRSHWYAIGHMSKVVKRGAVRIGSKTLADNCKCEAFLNPDGTHSLVLLNTGNQEVEHLVKSAAGNFTVVTSPRSVTSILW